MDVHEVIYRIAHVVLYMNYDYDDYECIRESVLTIICTQMCIPMELYKQNIIVLRLMLESDNIAHNEIALASMYRLFYMVEKNDPLPALVRDWMPGKYSKTHMYLLVELVHETLKVIELPERFINVYMQ